MITSQVLKRPIITEKSLSDAAIGRYTFEVERQATKNDIKKAVAEQFAVDVKQVMIRMVKGRTYRSGKRRQKRQRSPWKKTVVEVEKGQKITLFELGA